MTSITDVRLTKAISVVSAEIRLELTNNTPIYEGRMECTEALARIRQLLTAVCELYEIKELYWEETESLSDLVTSGYDNPLNARHYALNETIYQRLTEVGYLGEFLNPSMQREVDDMVDMIRPYLDKCVPRSGNLKATKGGIYEDPQQWYIAKRPDVQSVIEKPVEQPFTINGLDSDFINAINNNEAQSKRRTRSSKFA